MMEKPNESKGRALAVPSTQTATGVVHRAEGVDVSQGALLPPIVKLLQATTRDQGENAGKFLRTDTEEIFETLEVIPLISRVTQTRWPEGFSRDSQPACWSSNGLTADPGAEREGQECRLCPFWSPLPRKGKDKELCETGHNLILQDAESFDPLGMRLRGTSNRVVGLLTAPSIIQKAVVRLYSERFTDSRGSWFQLKAKTVRKLDEADADLARATMRGYRESNLGVGIPEREEPTPPEEPDGGSYAAAAKSPKPPAPTAYEHEAKGLPAFEDFPF